jgi:outer membrane protein assembly factor BamE (lipoprotein component of BamABCDE complex)
MIRLKSNKFFKKQMLASIVLAGLSVSACTTDQQVRGYISDFNELNGMTVGLDNINTVQNSLGRPSLTGTFNDKVWYYISTATINRSIYVEEPIAHSIYAFTFDDGGIVSEISKYNLGDIKKINPVSDKTPTRGKEFGFFEQIFGNIGRFAAPAPGT